MEITFIVGNFQFSEFVDNHSQKRVRRSKFVVKLFKTGLKDPKLTKNQLR